MAYVTPSSRSTGDLITAAIWNQDVVDNVVFLANAPAARAYNSANLSINDGTDTVLTLNSERFDNDTIHSTSSNTSRLTATTAGVYVISGNISWDNNATGTTRSISILLNGTTYIAFEKEVSPTNQILQQHISTIYKLAATDYVELEVKQDSGGALNVRSTANYSPEFGMTWISLG